MIRRFLRHYFYGLFARSWNNAWSAVDAGLGLGAAAAVSDRIDLHTWGIGVAFIFGSTFIRSAVTYFAKNPLPEKLPPTKPPFSDPST